MSIERHFSPMLKDALLQLSWTPLEKCVTQQLKLGLLSVMHDWKLLLFKFDFAAELEKRIIGERSEPHTYRTVGENLRHIYI